MQKYSVIGIMSGTSLDGLDIAHCLFEYHHKKWSVSIEHAITIPYKPIWKEKLSSAYHLSSNDLNELDFDYGDYIGRAVLSFLKTIKQDVDFIACHGHTIHHEPENGITTQIGSGKRIAEVTKLSTINDFRTKDVELGGQGAPLVPIGDLLLFSEYKYCINLGGFSNISIKNEGGIKAYDICPVNIVANALAQNLGFEFDNGGELGSVGLLNEKLLYQLNDLKFYKQKPPKSLGREWVEKNINPIIEQSAAKTEDQLCTFYHHIAEQISQQITDDESVYITGGGAFNKYLIELIQSKINGQVIIPSRKITDFKEAMIFAFLGCLFKENKINVLSSVTGAQEDHVGGKLHQP